MDQDWTSTTIHSSKAANASKASKPGTVNMERLHYTPEAMAARKLADTEISKPKILADRQEIVTRRLANKWSQADLNMHCRFPVNTIRDIESGKLCPSIQQLNSLNRVLKCGLKYA